MTKSHRKKRAIRKFKSWRLHNKSHCCSFCGAQLGQETHHHLCDNCHRIKRNVRKHIKNTL